MRLAGNLSGFPASAGQVGRLYNDTAETFRAMAASIDTAMHHVNALYYQTSWDEYTAPSTRPPSARSPAASPCASWSTTTACERSRATGTSAAA